MLLKKFILRILKNRVVICESWCSHRSGYKNSLLKCKVMEVNGQFHSQAATSLRKELTQQWIRGSIGPTAGRDGAMKRNILPGIDTWLCSQQPVPPLRLLILLGGFKHFSCACKMPVKQFCCSHNVRKCICLSINIIKYRSNNKYVYVKVKHWIWPPSKRFKEAWCYFM